MKQIIIVCSLAGWLILFCLTSGLFESFMMFLLFGALPWTSVVLSPQYMLTFCYMTAGTVILLLIRKQLQNTFSGTETTRRRSQA